MKRSGLQIKMGENDGGSVILCGLSLLPSGYRFWSIHRIDFKILNPAQRFGWERPNLD